MDRDKHIKSTDWLIKGYSEEELARIKAEAIKEAEAELRDKQIEEMAKFVCNACEMGCGFEGECSNFNDYKTCGISVETAKALYDAGYRKASEVAREIYEKLVGKATLNYYCGYITVALEDVASVVKEYIGEDINLPTGRMENEIGFNIN